MPETALTTEFKDWIARATRELALLANHDAPEGRASVLRMAVVYVKAALGCANALACPARRAVCLRILNWLRADLRREVA